MKTRDVLIEGSTFIDSTGPAIQVAAEGSWHESVSSADVTIRRNRFLRSGSGWGPAILVNIDCAESPPYLTGTCVSRTISSTGRDWTAESPSARRTGSVSGTTGSAARRTDCSGQLPECGASRQRNRQLGA